MRTVRFAAAQLHDAHRRGLSATIAKRSDHSTDRGPAGGYNSSSALKPRIGGGA